MIGRVTEATYNGDYNYAIIIIVVMVVVLVNRMVNEVDSGVDGDDLSSSASHHQDLLQPLRQHLQELHVVALGLRPGGLGGAGQVDDHQLGVVGLVHDHLVEFDGRVHPSHVGLIAVGMQVRVRKNRAKQVKLN